LFSICTPTSLNLLDLCEISQSHDNKYECVFRDRWSLCLSPGWSLISLMMEAASTLETSVNFYQITRRNIPEDSHLHSVGSRLEVSPSSCKQFRDCVFYKHIFVLKLSNWVLVQYMWFELETVKEEITFMGSKIWPMIKNFSLCSEIRIKRQEQ
jgi:hypothetical protein